MVFTRGIGFWDFAQPFLNAKVAFVATLPTEMLSRLPEPFSRRVLSRYVRIFTGTGCVQDCVSCPFPSGVERSFKPYDEIVASIDRAAQRGAAGLIFGGGEPAAHPRIHDLMIHAQIRNLAVAVASNGVLLAKKEILDGMYAAGLSRVHVHIFSHDPEKHKALAGGEADLDAMMDAVRRMVTDLIYVVAVLPLMRSNVQDLPEILALLTDAGVRKVHFTTPMNIRDPDDALDPVLLGAVLDAVMMDDRFSSVTFDRIPLCVAHFHLPSYAQTRHRDPILSDLDGEQLAWPCTGCQAVEACDGRVKRDSPQGWLRQLAPFQNPVSNSFNFALDRFLADVPSLEDCPVKAGDLFLPKMDADRDLLLHYNDRLLTVTTHTSDFRARDLEMVRERLGQVYLDVSEKVLLDDFDADLVPLRRAVACEGCEKRPECPGAFAPSELRVGFQDSEAQVLSVMSQLKGRVLDVGVGEPHSLRRCFNEETGSLPFEYVGIEPDPQRLDEVMKELPELTFFGGAAEDGDLYARFVENKSPFDHVVLLRSYNHLTDLVVAFENLDSVLKPGGTLLLVENTVFGLARGRQKLARLGQMEATGKAPFEHYRNHTSHEALRVLEHFGFEVLEHHPVGPDSANQWVLWLKKPEHQSA
jgi:molybdenum cofactor biosynthesis enzyme MoaA/SAM-dependent methyltransferase